MEGTHTDKDSYTKPAHERFVNVPKGEYSTEKTDLFSCLNKYGCGIENANTFTKYDRVWLNNNLVTWRGVELWATTKTAETEVIVHHFPKLKEIMINEVAIKA